MIFPHLDKLIIPDHDSNKQKPLFDEKEYFNSLKETTFKIHFNWIVLNGAFLSSDELDTV